MPNLFEKAKKSKLTQKNQDEYKGVVRKISPKENPKSYRFDYETINVLNELLEKVNQVAPKKISETRLIKALIHMGASGPTKLKEVLKSVQKLW